MTLPTRPLTQPRKGDGASNPGQFAETIKSADVESPIRQQQAVSEKEEARTKLAEAARNVTIMYINAKKDVTELALSKDSDGNLKGVALDSEGNEIPGSWGDVTHKFERQGGIRAEHILGDKDSDTFTLNELRGWADEPAQAEDASAVDVAPAAIIRPVRPTPPESLVKMREEEARRAARRGLPPLS